MPASRIFALAAHDPLRQRRLGTMKARAISGVRQPAEQSERRRDLRRRRQRGVAAREDQTEPVVLDVGRPRRRRRRAGGPSRNCRVAVLSGRLRDAGGRRCGWRAVVMTHPPGSAGALMGHRRRRRRRPPGPLLRRGRCHRRPGRAPTRHGRTPRGRPVRHRRTAVHRRASARRVVLEGPDLDRLAAGAGRLGRPCERRVEIGRLDDPEPADVFLGLRERSVRTGSSALRPDDGGRGRRQKAAAEDPRPRACISVLSSATCL